MEFSLIKKNRVFQKNFLKVVVKKLLRAGTVPARTWEVHAVGLARTEREKLRRQVAAAAGKNKHNLTVHVHGSMWSRSGGGAFYFGHSVLGGKSKKKLG